MKFKVGDFVRFIDEEGEGYITAILNDEMVGVTDADGFEIPVLASKVTTVYGQRERGEEEHKGITAAVEGPFITEGVSLALMGDPRQGILDFYLVNQTSYEVLFSFGTVKSAQLRGEKSGILSPQSIVKVYAANASKVGDWPLFNVQFIFHTRKELEAKKPITVDQKIRPADLSGTKIPVSLLDAKAWLFPLDEPQNNIDTDKLKAQFFSHRPERKS